MLCLLFIIIVIIIIVLSIWSRSSLHWWRQTPNTTIGSSKPDWWLCGGCGGRGCGSGWGSGTESVAAETKSACRVVSEMNKVNYNGLFVLTCLP